MASPTTGCGRPLGLLGLEKDEERIIYTIRKNLEEAGAEEILTMCPNCYYYLKDRLGIRVVSVYRRLLELGIEVEKPQGLKIFMPCPDPGGQESGTKTFQSFWDTDRRRKKM